MPAPAEVKGASVTTASVNNPAELLWNLIIRPPRSKYKPEQLGPTHFRIDKRAHVRRSDIQLTNPRGHKLQCSFFEPMQQAEWERSREASSSSNAGAAVGAAIASALGPTGHPQLGQQSKLPCIVFLHGNSSCRLEALPLVTLLLPLWISLFCFDFAGCGLSEGEFISLGWFERDDLATCVEYLRSTQRVSSIALWGRSMGAFTALLHADRDPTIAGLVLDSPFTSLTLLAEELAKSYAKVPAWMVRAVLAVVRSVINSKAGFDIEDLTAFEHVSCSFSPALFVAAKGDDFILPHHAEKLHEAYQGEKELHMVSGDHNSARPEACRRKAALFLCRTFHDERVDQLLNMHTGGLFDIFSGTAPPPTVTNGDSGIVCEDGEAICRQMQIFPALRMMILIRERRCRRPLVARTTVKLLQDASEAGFFVRLEPCCEDAGLQGHARMLVMTVSTSATIISRICDDALETVAVGPGARVREAQSLSLSIARHGKVQIQLGEDAPLEVEVGFSFREEVSLWLMLLHGQTSFGTLHVDDSEATLRENLGDMCLRHRHLGWGHSASAPAPLPRGDDGEGLVPLSPAHGVQTMPSPLWSTAAVESLLHTSRVEVMRDCIGQPEALVGWRVKVPSLGEGVVIGIRKRFGRATQHVIKVPEVGAFNGLEASTEVSGPLQGEPLWNVVLQRKASQVRAGRGLEFEPLHREF